MGRVREYFASKGIAPSDIGKSIVMLKLMAYTTYMGSLFLCYRYRPVVSFFKLRGPQRLHEHIRTHYRTQYERYHGYVMQKSLQLAEWRYFKPIPKFFGANSQRFTIALAENFVFYKATLPITLPLQVWLTLKFVSKQPSEVSMLDTFSAHLDDEEEVASSRLDAMTPKEQDDVISVA